jgi:3-hydroxybutyryl-CoA dehydratase
MSAAPGKIRVGDSAEHAFTLSADDMAVFSRLSGDSSLIHTDSTFAAQRGFKDVIVYGGLMLAKLSHVLGQLLPGRCGTSVKWTVTYRAPLYVDESACLTLQVVNVSPATGLVEARYRIVAGERLIAEGQTQSLVPLEQIATSPQEA